jgi:hypothetical protein
VVRVPTTCELCEFSYCEDIPSDVREHNKRHRNWILAREKHGFEILGYKAREESKESFYQKFPTADGKEKYEMAVGYMRQYFCRSLQSTGYSAKHMDFITYAGYMLGQKRFKELYADIYDELSKEYPPISSNDSINGSTYASAFLKAETKKGNKKRVAK